MNWLYSPLLPGAAQQEAGEAATEDAAGLAAGTGTVNGQAAAVASSVFGLSGASELAAIGAFDGDAPQEETPATQALDATGAGGLLHPNLVTPRKKRKPRIIKADDQSDNAAHQADADFHTLWESVRIKNDPERMRAVIEKRRAMLHDLEQATLIRQVRY